MVSVTSAVRWTLDYGKLDKTPEVGVVSPVYHNEQDGIRTDWQLILYPGGVKSENEVVNRNCRFFNPVAVCLKLVRCNYTAVEAKFKVSIHPDRTLTRDSTAGVIFKTMRHPKCWFRVLHNCNTCNTRSNVPPTTLSSTVASGQKMEVSCDIYHLRLVEGAERLDVMPINVKGGLIDNLRSFYELGKLTDYKIIVGEATFRVHKAVLAARSPVIAAMFEHDLREKTSNCLEIVDFTAEVVKRFIDFLYSGNCLDFGDDAADLLAMADKYDVKDLKLECEFALARKLDASNAAAVLYVADLHRATHLKKAALRFIKHNIKAVMAKDEKWESLPRSLIDEFIKFLVPQLFV